MSFIRQSRSTGTTPLDNAMLMRMAPSIFALEPYHKMSDKYGFVPTIDVIEAMRSEGYQPFRAFEARTRIDDKHGYVKHLIRLRHADAAPMKGDLFPEIILVNSHDGASAYQMHAGLFRLVCSNGMIVADSTFEKVSIRHSGSVLEEAMRAAFAIGGEVPRIQDQVEQFQAITLTPNEQGIFAEAALSLRYPEAPPINPVQLLNSRRYEDKDLSLFTTLNKVQENIVKGGIHGQSQGRTRRRMTTRAITGVDQDVKLNKALWLMAERMAELKQAA